MGYASERPSLDASTFPSVLLQPVHLAYSPSPFPCLNKRLVAHIVAAHIVTSTGQTTVITMAVIEVYHGIKVGIRDARDPAHDLPEYPDTSASSASSPSRTLGSTRYIACRDAQAFVVHLSVSNAYDFSRPRPHSLNLAVFIDGTWAAGKLCRAPDVQTRRPFRANIDHRLHKYFDGTLVRQPFIFSGLKTGEWNESCCIFLAPISLFAAACPLRPRADKEDMSGQRRAFLTTSSQSTTWTRAA